MVYGKGSFFVICTLLLICCSLLEWTEARCHSPSEEVGRRLHGFRERQHGMPKHIRRKPWEMGLGIYKEGDIMEKPARQRNGIALTVSPNARWPNAIVPYVISPTAFTAAQRAIILEGMKQFATNTCVRFVQRTTQSLYITIDSTATGCWSYVGRSSTNTYNQVNLQASDCVDVGTVTHELMHAIGFYHEFTRPDRDSYVTIDRTALAAAYRTQTFYNENFAKMAYADVVLYGRPYDYGSVMHYSKYAAAASNNRPVMNNIQPWTGDFGNDNGLSAADIIDINYMYCNATSTTTQATTTTTTASVTTTTNAAVSTTTVRGATSTTIPFTTTTVRGTTSTAVPVITTTVRQRHGPHDHHHHHHHHHY
ncbi:zinc metalloproteinase nas-1-like [Anopheles ziemanni]|uniref:zinc metalloproteinase nas-1-like n=1 Tax=Anopheles coustani TaxID=139045 RepID=UPI002657C833|nr:zinc metalloproteinase nas-1-like [Anopheles coustani]XP_058169889.1 zinc metalloproteinase nas-1-like [Anopheles ziemanni]